MTILCAGRDDGDPDDTCGVPARHRVEWIKNPSGLPGTGELVRSGACSRHLSQVVRRGQGEAVGKHVHVLPAGSSLKWWES